MKQAPPVKNQKEIIPGKSYYLSELPDGIAFSFKEKRYKTVTYPQYNVINVRQRRRECLNLTTLKTENLLYGCVIIVEK